MRLRLACLLACLMLNGCFATLWADAGAISQGDRKGVGASIGLNAGVFMNPGKLTVAAGGGYHQAHSFGGTNSDYRAPTLNGEVGLTANTIRAVGAFSYAPILGIINDTGPEQARGSLLSAFVGAGLVVDNGMKRQTGHLVFGPQFTRASNDHGDMWSAGAQVRFTWGWTAWSGVEESAEKGPKWDYTPVEVPSTPFTATPIPGQAGESKESGELRRLQEKTAADQKERERVLEYNNRRR